MFTDWTMTDPHYFYWRGALYGAVVASLFWRVLWPWIWQRLMRHRRADRAIVAMIDAENVDAPEAK